MHTSFPIIIVLVLTKMYYAIRGPYSSSAHNFMSNINSYACAKEVRHYCDYCHGTRHQEWISKGMQHPCTVVVVVKTSLSGFDTIITRALQSTYPARCICIYLKATGTTVHWSHVCICWRPLPTYARPVVRMSRKHMGCNIIVGTVDRRGQQKRTICDARRPCQSSVDSCNYTQLWY